MNLERGSLLNQRYRIVEILGQGGMAAVYRAIDENLGVEVAVKENLFTTDEYARQFRREAVILANLRHSNLPRVTDHFVIEQQGQYLVMDYIEGEDLRQRMERLGELQEGEVVIIGVALCEALTHLHTRNPQVLHRDIKPGNVKITPSGQIFLVDFGLAKMVVGRQATTTGARAMTPGYSPPEQYGTARTDLRSDIYSLGATLYSALTNAIPEDGLARAMEQVRLTPLQKKNPKLTKRLANTLEKALEVKPDDRYQSAEEFKNALLNSRSSTRRRQPLDLLLEPPPEGPESSEVVPSEGNHGPDITDENSGNSNGLISVPISDVKQDRVPVLSPVRSEGKNRGGNFLRSMFLWLILFMVIVGAVIVYLNPEIPSRVWRIISPGVNTVMGRITPTTTLTETLIPIESTATSVAVAETAKPSATITSTLIPTDTLEPSPSPTLTSTATPAESPTPMPTPTSVGGGRGQIAFASNGGEGAPNIWLIDVDGKGIVQLTDIPEGACQPTWSPDGMRLVFVSPCDRNRDAYPGSSLLIINVDGSGARPLTSSAGGDYDPKWSPDGKYIAFVSLRVGGVPQIFIYDIDSGTTVHLSDDTLKANTQPTWSPDSKMIAYVGSDNQIRAMQLDGSGRFLLARNTSDFKNSEPVWSPDGSSIIFTQATLDQNSVWLAAVPFSIDGNVPVKIPNSDYLTGAQFSPDGFWITTIGYPQGTRDLYIMTTSGVNRTQITQDEFTEFDPSWRPFIP